MKIELHLTVWSITTARSPSILLLLELNQPISYTEEYYENILQEKEGLVSFQLFSKE